MRPGRTNIPGNGHPVAWTEQTCISHPQAEGSGRHILVDNGSLRTCIHGTGAPDVEKRLVLAVRVRHPRSHDLGHSFFRSFRTGIIVPVVRSQRLLRPADVSASVAFPFSAKAEDDKAPGGFLDFPPSNCYKSNAFLREILAFS